MFILPEFRFSCAHLGMSMVQTSLIELWSSVTRNFIVRVMSPETEMVAFFLPPVVENWRLQRTSIIWMTGSMEMECCTVLWIRMLLVVAWVSPIYIGTSRESSSPLVLPRTCSSDFVYLDGQVAPKSETGPNLRSEVSFV